MCRGLARRRPVRGDARIVSTTPASVLHIAQNPSKQILCASEDNVNFRVNYSESEFLMVKYFPEKI